MTDHQPRKRFGQHFLQDRNVIRRIVEGFNPKPGERVVEIGPGLGALTLELLPRLGVMHAVELDRDLIGRLEEAAAGLGELIIHQADARRFDFCGLMEGPQKLRVIGNLPYNISTPLLFHLLEQADCIEDMHFMLQAEVVDRLAAGPGGKDYGRLSVMIQWRCRVERLLAVDPAAFSPPPRVDSAVVRLIPHLVPPVAVAEPGAFALVVRRAFAQRRKTLRNALKGLLSPAQIAQCEVDAGARAEQLSLEQFARLGDTVKWAGRREQGAESSEQRAASREREEESRKREEGVAGGE